jgi:hypothetical protein
LAGRPVLSDIVFVSTPLFSRCHVPFKVLTRISWMILHICDVPNHFQESPVWNYFDFQFEDMGYMKKYLVRWVIFKNLIVNVTTNQYQYKMKNESSQRLIHFNKLLFCWKYTITNETNLKRSLVCQTIDYLQMSRI